MFRNNRECRYAGKCPRYDAGDEFCFEDGGKRTDGRPAECYKNMSPVYRAARFLRHPFRNITEGLSSRVVGGIMKAGGIDGD